MVLRESAIRTRPRERFTFRTEFGEFGAIAPVLGRPPLMSYGSRVLDHFGNRLRRLEVYLPHQHRPLRVCRIQKIRNHPDPRAGCRRIGPPGDATPFWMLRIMPLGSPDAFRPNASFPEVHHLAHRRRRRLQSRSVGVGEHNQIAGLICVLSVGSVMQALSKVTELPSAAIFPPQPGLAGGPALGTRYAETNRAYCSPRPGSKCRRKPRL